MVKARQIVGILDNNQDTDSDVDPDSPFTDTTLPSPDVVAYRVQTRQSFTATELCVSPLTVARLGT